MVVSGRGWQRVSVKNTQTSVSYQTQKRRQRICVNNLNFQTCATRPTLKFRIVTVVSDTWTHTMHAWIECGCAAHLASSLPTQRMSSLPYDCNVHLTSVKSTFWMIRLPVYLEEPSEWIQFRWAVALTPPIFSQNILFRCSWNQAAYTWNSFECRAYLTNATPTQWVTSLLSECNVHLRSAKSTLRVLRLPCEA